MLLDGSHDGDKTRERKRKGQENQGKNNKKKLVTHEVSRSSGRSWVVGSNEIGRHCNNYYGSSVVVLINHSRHG